MITSELILTRSDAQALRIKDAYSLHRVVYDLFPDVRSGQEKQASKASGILYADKGGDFNSRKILIVSDREPDKPKYGTIKSKIISEKFLWHKRYGFEVIINPTKRDKNTGKTVAILGSEAIERWFLDKSSKSWGFSVESETLQLQEISVQRFEKKECIVTQNKAKLKGKLVVIDQEVFINSFRLGIGRGRAFGFGLLQIIPLSNFSTN